MINTKIFILFLFLIFLNFSCIKIKDYSTNFEHKNELKNNKNNNENIIDLQKQLHLIAENESSSIVSISSEKFIIQKYFDLFDYFFRDPRNSQPEEKRYKQTALGSGIIYKKNRNQYYIITNNHVAGQVEEISVTFYDGKEYQAKLIGGDPNTDIAVVKIDPEEKLKEG